MDCFLLKAFHTYIGATSYVTLNFSSLLYELPCGFVSQPWSSLKASNRNDGRVRSHQFLPFSGNIA